MTQEQAGPQWQIGDAKDGLPVMVRWPVTDGKRRFNLFSYEEAQSLRDLLNLQTANEVADQLRQENERLKAITDDWRDEAKRWQQEARTYREALVKADSMLSYIRHRSSLASQPQTASYNLTFQEIDALIGELRSLASTQTDAVATQEAPATQPRSSEGEA